MKRNRFFTAISLAAALALAACTQDYEMAAADDDGEALPEGMYPLQIGSISVSAEGSGQPWTRVAETADGSGSVFETGDMFYVKFEGSEQVGTYRIAEAGTVEAVDPVYWQSASEEQTIIAWYPAATEIDFTQQDKNGLTYLLKATTDQASYNTAANLTFTHQLAKVRVVLTGTKASEVADVKIRSHPNASISQGTLSNISSTAAYYPMFKATYGSTTCWEANMIPGMLIANDSFHIISKSDGTTVNVTLNGNVTIEAGKMHTITITVEPSAEELKTTCNNAFFNNGNTSSPIGKKSGSYYNLYATSSTIQKLINDILKTSINVWDGEKTITAPWGDSIKLNYTMNCLYITVESTDFCIYWGNEFIGVLPELTL